MNRLIGRYPLTVAYVVAVGWLSSMVWMTELLR